MHDKISTPARLPVTHHRCVYSKPFQLADLIRDGWCATRIFSLWYQLGSLNSCPLSIHFPDYTNNGSATSNGSTDFNLTTLIHWNPVAARWEQSSKTCGYEKETEVWDRKQGTVTVKVCSTRKSVKKNGTEPLYRKRRQISSNITEALEPREPYFSVETQFGLAIISESIPNTPPVLLSQTNVTINEEEGLSYQLTAEDADDDPILFSLEPSYQGPTSGELTLSENGLLVYTPDIDWFGEEIIPIVLVDNPVHIQPTSSKVTITITVEDVTDVPVIFLTSMGQSILLADPTEPIAIMIEELSDALPDAPGFEVLLGAYDVDITDILTIVMQGPFNGTLQVGTEDTSIPEMTNCSASLTNSSFPCGELQLPHPAAEMAWKYMTMQYQPAHSYYGSDIVKMYIKDSKNGTSDVLTLQFAILEFPCFNGGSCSIPDAADYLCEDLRRAESFDKYYNCSCVPGYIGQYCETNFDECSSSPCDAVYICIDGVNTYTCRCPDDDPECDRVPTWAIVVIVLVCSLLVTVGIIGFLFYRKKQKDKLDAETYYIRKRGSTSSFGSEGFEAEHFNRGFLEDGFMNYIEGEGGMLGFSDNPAFLPPMSTLYTDDFTGLNQRLPAPLTPSAIVALEPKSSSKNGSVHPQSPRSAWDENTDNFVHYRSRSNSATSYTNTIVQDLTRVPILLQQLIDHEDSSSYESSETEVVYTKPKKRLNKTERHLNKLDKKRVERLVDPVNPSVKPQLIKEMIKAGKTHPAPDVTHLGKRKVWAKKSKKKRHPPPDKTSFLPGGIPPPEKED
ncbi:hypothetical protein ScPMuIL_009410 [Solemya velum]